MSFYIVHLKRRSVLRRSRRQGPASNSLGWELGSSLYSTGPLVVFLLAALFVVGAVWLLTVSTTFWMLSVAAAMHAVATVLVLAAVVRLLNED